MTNERQFSQDWNPVWTLKTGRFDGYWTVEAQIPFKSIRYGEGRYQVWGFNVARIKRSKNEMSTLSRVPPARGRRVDDADVVCRDDGRPGGAAGRAAPSTSSRMRQPA